MAQSPVASPELKPRRWQLADFAPAISLLVPVLFFSLVSPSFLSLGTFSLVLQQGSVLAIAAVGLTFVLLCAEIDLSVGMMALFAASFCGVLYESDFAAGHLPTSDSVIPVWKVAMVIGVPLVAALAFGIVSGFFTVSSRLPSFIITLAMMNITYGLSKYITESEPFKLPGILNQMGNDKAVTLLTIKMERTTDSFYIPWSAVLAGIVMLAGHLVLQHTRFGRHVYMTGGNRTAARLAGIRTDRVVVVCLAICAVCSGLAGMVNAGRLESVTQDQNSELLLQAVACVVLGGTSLFGGEGSMGRTLLGVLTFTFLTVGLNGVKVDPRIIPNFDLLRPFLLGVILMIALVVNGYLARLRK